ncbi:expressed unknown protein [Seminavis robusta]|uniref:Uncharacterized protein n=1 Tax=Seminavis robusta TaxID=568900 RepID=A0A9N8EBA0_9STRA|nr:expressed unknown protein [Seminavis robusta]|eukprot:Sro840_g209420.1 n/a (292) ;mRNA; r:24162-25212
MMRWPVSTLFALASFLTTALLILPANAINLARGADELVSEQDLSTFLAQEELPLPLQDERKLGSGQSIGEKCGKNSPCQDGLQCTPITVGNRCVPVECLSTEYNGTLGALDMVAYNDLVYQQAGITEQQFVEAFRDADNQRAFVDSDEFRAFSRAMRSNTGPLEAMQELHKRCNAGRQTSIDTTYFGINIEAGAFVDFNFQFLFAERDGAAVGTGSGAELACVFCWLDLDLGVGLSGGVAIGIGFNGIFQYEFTIGIGFGGGLGTSLCSGWAIFEQIDPTEPPEEQPPERF